MRSRNIKPGFFKNEELVKLPESVRLLFIGLWCLADRKGRLEDRPAKIKMEIYPSDQHDIDTMLTQLQYSAFIERYIADEKRYIQIINFEKHQYPHVKEQASTIPAPGMHQASTRLTRLNPSSLIPESRSTESLHTPPTPKERRSPEVRVLVDYFYQKLTFVLKEKPSSFNGGALGRLLKTALATHTEEDIKGRIDAWFLSTDPFIVTAHGYSSTLFVSKFNILKGGPIHGTTNTTSSRGYIGAPVIANKYAALGKNKENPKPDQDIQ